MKKTLLYCITCIFAVFFACSLAYAAPQISLESSKAEYGIEDNIEVYISVQTDGTQSGDLEVKGLKNFQMIGKSKSDSFQSINGEASKTTQWRLTLLALEAGEFIIGPIELTSGGEKVLSETITLTITGERIMVDNKLKSFQNNLGITPPSNNNTQEEDDEDISKLDLGSSKNKEEENLLKAPLGLDGKPMSDIYTVKEKVFDYPFSKDSFWLLLFLIIGGILYFILRKYIEENTKLEEIKEEDIIILKGKDDYSKLYNELEESLTGKKKLFYKNAGYIIRSVISEDLGYTVRNRSLKEVSKLIKGGKLEVYKSIYYPEYNSLFDEMKERENILKEVKTVIIEHTTKQ